MSFKNTFYLSFLIFSLVFIGTKGHCSEYDPLKERVIKHISEIPNYREKMRELVIPISQYVKRNNPDFTVNVVGGLDLLYESDWEKEYSKLLKADKYKNYTEEEIKILDEIAKKNKKKEITPISYENYLKSIDSVFLKNRYCEEKGISATENKVIKASNIAILGLEKCETPELLETAISTSIADAVPISAELEGRPTLITDTPLLENAKNILNFKDARNILFIKDTSKYKSKEDLMLDIAKTNYDIIVIEPFFQGEDIFSKEDIRNMQYKKTGAKRMALAYIKSSAITKNDRIWQPIWTLRKPAWLKKNSEEDEGVFLTEYWDTGWRNLLGHIVKYSLSLGFSGILLDYVETYKDFEEMTPINY